MAGSDFDVREITQLLNQREDEAAGDRLFRLVYAELHRQATQLMRKQDRGHTLQATALVNEAYLKLAGSDDMRWECRSHFFSVAARAMRSILIDHARTKSRQKRGGEMVRVPIDEISVLYESRAVDLIQLDDALEQLSSRDALAARIVELRFFGGVTLVDIARLQGVSIRRIERNWEFARSWLRLVLR